MRKTTCFVRPICAACKPRDGAPTPQHISRPSPPVSLARRSTACWRIDRQGRGSRRRCATEDRLSLLSSPTNGGDPVQLDQACGCGSRPPVSGRGRGLPAGGTAETRGVGGSIKGSRGGRLPERHVLV